MVKKNLFKTLIILMGVIMLFSFSKVQAAGDASVFGRTITRETLATASVSGALTTELELKDSQYRYNDTKKIWEIVNKMSPNDIYYCLNMERGFGGYDGIAENSKDTYTYKELLIEGDFYKYSGVWEDKSEEEKPKLFNKILWILNNIYIPTSTTESTSIYDEESYKSLMDKAGIEIYDDGNLTKEDILTAQRLAIWHYTNEFNSIDSIDCINEKNESILPNWDEKDSDLINIVKYSRKSNLMRLYNYFIENADENYTTTETKAILGFENIEANINEQGEYYLAGPFKLNKTDNVTVKVIAVDVDGIQVEYTIVDENNEEIEDYSNEFYIKISKNQISNDSEIHVSVNGKYLERTLTFMTNSTEPGVDSEDNYENTQPVVLVKEEEKEISAETNINIALTQLTVKKVWSDINNKDNLRPEKIKVQLYKNGEPYGNSVELNSENNWAYTWENLLDLNDYKYSIKELDEDGNPVENNENYDENYTTTYAVNGAITTITNSYIPPEITGNVSLILKKVDENGNILNGSIFKVDDKEYDLTNGQATIGNVQIIDELLADGNEIFLDYTIQEIDAPDGYKKIENDIQIYLKATVAEEENKYKITKIEQTDEEGIVLSDEELNEDITVALDQNTNTITITVKNHPLDKKFDLALRKFVTKVNSVDFNNRYPVPKFNKDANITYKHTKQPIVVQKGDIVTYTIRVYNEGEVDGYAEMITDHLPENLKPIIDGVEGIAEGEYEAEKEFNLFWGWTIDEEEGYSIVHTTKTRMDNDSYGEFEYYEVISEEYPDLVEKYSKVEDTLLEAYEPGKLLDYIDVQIKCLVTENAVRGEYLTNIAEITSMRDKDGEIIIEDIDSSVPEEIEKIENLSNYKNEEAIKSNENSYIAGQEDDDDFEKLVVHEFDLSLRKFVSKVNNTTYSRAPIVDASKLGTVVDGKTITTAIYTHSKEPVLVKTGDIVTYTIRVYNEGTLDGFAKEITDNIPEGLEFLPDSEINKKWTMLDKDGKETDKVSEAVMIVTDSLAEEKINPVSEENGQKILDHKEVQVQFKVVAKAENLKENIIINEAQISKASNERDIDSVPKRDEKYDYDFEENEDDIDYEKIKIPYFDLALRKFVTKVNSVDFNNRYPTPKFNKDGTITYEHTKDPVLVNPEDIVEYTIRVYNEGEIAGTATEITDNIPEGLEFIKDYEINEQYKWNLIDAEGNETDDVTKAVKITTDYLKNKSIDPLIKEGGQKVLSCEDVKVAFIVTSSEMEDKILVNTAQISEDSEDDIDSIPGNDELKEDDIDKEYVKVQYFDLSLKKWVTETQVTFDGKTTITKTGFTEDSKELAKVDLVASKMKKTTVKFVYNIKVTNEGELPGCAYEIKDYIPNGLKFVAEDNPDWKELEDGIIVTNKLEDTILNPGESATVEVTLTWKNSTTNLGTKTNYAEIRKDSGNDIDSIPDNFSKTEDDIDDAQVILSIKTAGATTYIGLVFITVAILACGIFLIKKYVLD